MDEGEFLPAAARIQALVFTEGPEDMQDLLHREVSRKVL